MKTIFLRLSVIALFLLLMGAGCKDEEPLETDPAQIILGKWEITYMGNEQVENPTAYKEYMKDSVLREYDYETGEYYYKKYSIDTLLHEYIYIPQEGYYMLFFEYSYDFAENNNKMYLKYTNFIATYNYFTFERIK